MIAVLSSIPMLAPFRVRSFRFQFPADLLTSWGGTALYDATVRTLDLVSRETGLRTATYKLATLMALVEHCIENLPQRPEDTLRVPLPEAGSPGEPASAEPTEAGSPEEEDYLGLPGLLEPDDVGGRRVGLHAR